jgi:hypothetical protein
LSAERLVSLVPQALVDESHINLSRLGGPHTRIDIDVNLVLSDGIKVLAKVQDRALGAGTTDQQQNQNNTKKKVSFHDSPHESFSCQRVDRVKV